ncbi:MAG TPA: WhiB family transcriptional regulator [Acidimicrobiales bacterium]|nr:WhiB family transcriptional regulator [Acidimicrobiales bacterium]
MKKGTWTDSAACRGTDTEIFYPANAEEEAEALSICATCPVRAQCLDYAIRNRETYGIWGGTTPEQRRRIRREQAA